MSKQIHLTRFVLAFTVACSSETTTQPMVDPAATVARVSINAPRTLLALNATVQLSADVLNAAGASLAGKATTWMSDRPDIVTVDATGLVRGVAAGSALITATSGGRAGTVILTIQNPNRVLLASDSGDYIGLGATYSYTNANAAIGIAYNINGAEVRITISGNQNWRGVFTVPLGSQLAPGVYANAVRIDFSGRAPQMDWGGEFRGCNTLTGFFAIDSLRWSNGSGSPILALDMRFEQHCDGAAPALHGTIRWRPDDPTTAPSGPQLPIPTDLWRPPASLVPATGDYVYLQSDSANLIGGRPTFFSQTGIVVAGSGRHISVSGSGYVGTFTGMNAITQLQVGYYGSLLGDAFHNPVFGGLDWGGNGIGCDPLTGWFAVDRANYVNEVLTGIELRFETHCDGESPTLYGAVRWGQFPK